MIQEPSSICIAGEALGGSGGQGEGAASTGPPALWPALTVWQDQMVAWDGGWRRKAAVPAADPDPSPPQGSKGGCAAFLRSRQRRQPDEDHQTKAGTGQASVCDAQPAGQGTNDVLDAVADARAERRTLLALTGESVVVSLCIHEQHRQHAAVGAAEGGEGPTRQRDADVESVADGERSAVSGSGLGSGSVWRQGRKCGPPAHADVTDRLSHAPMASVAGTDGEYDLRVRREEALWRLDEWMRFVFAR